jgi:hypothetical protein
MTANISIPVASAENVVAAPLSAVFTETNPETREIERHAWVRRPEGWERRPIRLGVSDYFFAEITGGLAAGDEVSLVDRSKEAVPAAPGAKSAASSATPAAPSRPPTATR